MSFVRLRLREQIPLLLLAVALGIGGLSWWLQLRSAFAHVEETAEIEARATVQRLAVMVGHELRERDVDGLARELAGLALNPHVGVAAVYGEDARLLAASVPAGGGDLASTLPRWTHLAWPVLRPQLQAVGSGSTAVLDAVLTPGCFHLYSVVAGASVYLQFDYDDHLAAARRLAETNARAFGALVAGSALLIGIFLHYRVTARAARIVDAADRYGRGERGLRCRLGGHDELSRVGRALDRMMTRIDEAQARLTDAENGQRMLIENLPGAVFIESADRPGYTKYVSPQLKVLFGHEPTAWVEGGYDYWARHVHPADRERADSLWRESCASGAPYFCEYRLLSPDGRLHWVQDTVGGAPIVVGGERLSYGFMLDVSARRHAEEALREHMHLLKTAHAIAGVGAWSIGPGAAGRMRWSDETYRLFGVSADSFPCTIEAWLAGVLDEDRTAVRAAFERLIEHPHTGPADVRYRYRRPDGALRWMHSHADCVWSIFDDGWLIAGVVRDVTEQVEAERHIERLAYHDVLTGLPNRALFVERLHRAVAEPGPGCVAVLYLDLDQFKAVNDTLGHAIGDRLLQQVALRFSATLAGSATVARYGGDEYIVLLPDLAAAADATQIADQLCASLREPVAVDGQRLHVTATIGVAVATPTSGIDGETLIRHADLALYAAKSAGRDGWHLFSDDMDRQMQARRQLENDLRRALEREEFVLHYQPQIDLGTGRMVGVEALLRWQHPERGLVLPGEFIPLAEDSQLITPIGEWVLVTAVAQLAAWRAAGLPTLRMAVNLSARQFQDQALPDKLRAILHAHDIEPALLELEVTESCVLRQSDRAYEMLVRLRELGVSIAIDDFGTGYSNLGALKQYPFARLKIDRLFIRDIVDSVEAGALVRAIFAMADALHLPVVAEGVESADQLDLLDELGCGEVQGYHTGRPMPAAALAQLFATTPRRRRSPLR